MRGEMRVKRVASVIAASAMAGAAGACATSDRLSRTEQALTFAETTAPIEWTAGVAPAAPPTGDWVGGFGDPGLERVLSAALSDNFDLAAASARLEQARQQARAAGAPLFPAIDANLSASGSEFGDAVIGVGGSESYGLSASASWEADVWGRVRDGARAGAVDAVASEADYMGARLSLAGAVARGWYDLAEAQLLVVLAEDEVATQERSLRLTQRRYESGVTGALDVRLARSSLATSQFSRAQSRTFRNNAARRLEVLLGRYPAGAIAGPTDLPDLPALDGSGAPADLLARRPDLRAAEARLESAGLRARQARKALLPRLTLTGSSGTNVGEFSDVFDSDYLVSTIGGGLLQPIFRGGALRAEAGRARAAADERLAAYANLALTAYREAEDALDAEMSLVEQEAALAVAADEAAEAEALAERNYTSGVGTIFELLDAQRRRISAQRQLITIRADRVTNRIGLHLAIGGDILIEQEPAVLQSAPGAVDPAREDIDS